LIEVRAACLGAASAEKALRDFNESLEASKSAVTVKAASNSIAERAAMFTKQTIDTSATDRIKLERDVNSAKRKEREVLARASRVIDEEVAKIDLDTSNKVGKEERARQEAARDKEEAEARERQQRKTAIKVVWEGATPVREGLTEGGLTMTPVGVRVASVRVEGSAEREGADKTTVLTSSSMRTKTV
jgi:hypothetical protein